jgi:hypothetical protein
VGPLAGQAVATPAGPSLRWDAESRTLSVDPLTVDSLSDGSSARSFADPLAGGSLRVDPLSYAGRIDGRDYFIGNEVRLAAQDGDTLLRASLPLVVLDEALFAAQGFNLFAPVLNISEVETTNSPWLASYVSTAAASTRLPELFIGAAPLPDPLDWTRDFVVPVKGVLSFTGGPEGALASLEDLSFRGPPPLRVGSSNSDLGPAGAGNLHSGATAQRQIGPRQFTLADGRVADGPSRSVPEPGTVYLLVAALAVTARFGGRLGRTALERGQPSRAA